MYTWSPSPATILDKVIGVFMNKYLSGRTNIMSLGQILQAIDLEVDKDIYTPEETAATLPQLTAASQFIKEIESLQAENDALRGQLLLKIQELRKMQH